MRYDTICSFAILVFLVVLFSHGNIFNKHGPKPYSIVKVLHHKQYRGIQQEYIRI